MTAFNYCYKLEMKAEFHLLFTPFFLHPRTEVRLYLTSRIKPEHVSGANADGTRRHSIASHS